MNTIPTVEELIEKINNGEFYVKIQNYVEIAPDSLINGRNEEVEKINKANAEKLNQSIIEKEAKMIEVEKLSITALSRKYKISEEKVSKVFEHICKSYRFPMDIDLPYKDPIVKIEKTAQLIELFNEIK